MSHPLFTNERFLKFCRSKPPEEEYQYHSYQHCACGQYTASLGIDYYDTWSAPNITANFTRFFRNLETEARKFPRTWGALAERVERNLIGVSHV